MGMCSHVMGVRDLDGRFTNMIAAKVACEKAEIPYPQEIINYFLYPEQSEESLRQQMETINIDIAVSEYKRDGTEWGKNSTDGFEVDLSRLPSGTKAIRFENSY